MTAILGHVNGCGSTGQLSWSEFHFFLLPFLFFSFLFTLLFIFFLLVPSCLLQLEDWRRDFKGIMGLGNCTSYLD